MRRRLIIVAVFLLAGAVVNVAVAWGIAILVDFRAADKVVGGAKGRRGDWVIWHHGAGGCIRIRALAVSGNNIEELEQYPMQPWVLPSWGPLAEQVRQQVGEPFLRVADAYGWPTHSMWSAFAWNTEQWPNVLTDLGLVVAIFVVDWIIARSKASRSVEEIRVCLDSALGASRRFLVGVDSQLDAVSGRSIGDLSAEWVANDLDPNVVKPEEFTAILRAAEEMRNEFDESLAFGSWRCRDLGIAFAHALPPTEVAAISHHAYGLHFLRAALLDRNARDVLSAVLHLTNNLRALEEQLKISE